MLALHRLRRALPLWSLGVLLCLPACRNTVHTATSDGATPVPSPQPAREVSVVNEPGFEGFRIRIGDADGDLGEAGVTRALPAQTTALGKDRTGALIERLPPLLDAVTAEFALRPGSAPPPRTGQTVQVPFPAPPGPPAPDPSEQGPLSVIRYAPEGEVPIAPHLSVTFSQPMIAVSTQDEAAAQVPVTITPQPPGQWRWLGTKTVLFEPLARFPMATEYSVQVPAGAASATGGSLSAAHRFTFATPALKLLGQHPTGGPQSLDPVVFLSFDQAIDRTALMASISLRTGATTVPVRLATEAEVQADPSVRSMAASTPPDRWIALVPTAPLPKDTQFTVRVAKGAPSAEGPRGTPTDQAFSFRTYGPLRLTEHRCSWGDRCPPESDWSIGFSNALDAAAFDGAAWTVAPQVRALDVSASGAWVNIHSVKAGRTTYTVTVPGGLRDVYGQTLGRDTAVTFKVGPGDKALSGPPREFIVLDPGAPPTFPVYSTNHSAIKMRVFAAEPSDWSAVSAWMRDRYNEQRASTPPLKRVASVSIPIESVPDDLVETSVDLKPYLPSGRGNLLLWIEPTSQPRNRWERTDIFAWVQATDVGLAAYTDQTELLAWATDLQTGAPAKGLQMVIESGAGEAARTPAAATDAQGLATLALPSVPAAPQTLVARRDGQAVAFLPQQVGWWNQYPGWYRNEVSDDLRWLVYDDRGLYRPGETVSVKGYVRAIDQRRGGDLRASEVTRVLWTLKGPRWNELSSGEAQVNDLGGFHLALALPPDVNLGNATLDLTAVDGSAAGSRAWAHSIKIAEFRRPEFEVKATADPGPWVLGEHAVVEVSAAYFAGGGLPGAETTWTAQTAPASYSPPGWSGWSFGTWTAWWRFWDLPSGPDWQDWQSHQGVTDGLGTHRLRVDFEQMNPPRPWSVMTEATVMDVNRQAWTAKKTLLVHPGSVYAGLKTDKSFIGADEPITIEVIAADIDGQVSPGRAVEVALERLEWSYERGRWTEAAVDRSVCTVTSAADAQRCRFEPSQGGSWRVRATVTDEHGRPNRSELRFWVSGGAARPNRDLQEEELTLVPDQQEYQPGDVARILVQSPFAPFEGLVTVQRSGLVSSERFRSPGATWVIEVPITEAHLSQLTVQVDAAGEAARLDASGRPLDKAPKRPAFATGQLRLKVPPAVRTLNLDVAPAQPELEPGSATSIALTLTDADGQPVAGAELALAVVDESVLALTGHSLVDPLAVFYAARPAGVATSKLRSHVLLADAEILAAAAAGPGGGGAPETGAMPPPSVSAPRKTMDSRSRGGDRMEMMMDVSPDMDDEGGSREPEPLEEASEAPTSEDGGDVAIRRVFDALALFAPQVRTDAAGKATVPLTLPDSLTRYRVMVIAVAGGTLFGSGESTITARKPLMVRPSPPRFLNFGDELELPVIVQNQTRAPMEVEVAMRTSNLALRGGAFANGAAVRVTVPAQDRAEVRFPAAARMAGTARFQVLALSGKGATESSDAAEQDLPVWTPATSEAFATYGAIDDGVLVQPVQTPGAVWPQFGGLEITTSSTAMQALTDAVIYLVRYPFECAEQLSSRILGIAALRDVLTAFEADELPSVQELEKTVAADLDLLKRRQNPDGGFGFWRRGQESWPWVSIHAAHAMARADLKGYTVDPGMRQRALSYLRTIDSHIPSWYSVESRRTIIAYAVATRDLLGDKPIARARTLWSTAGVDGLSNEALGWLMPVLHGAGDTDAVASIERHFLNNVSETSAMAHFVDSYSDGAHVLMHSDRRADAIVLEAMIRVRPDSDLIVKVVKGLMAQRTRGRWLNTQENVFVLLALDRYFNVFEKETPDFVARAWLGDDFAGEHTFRGRSTERAYIGVPMAQLAATPGAQPLTLQKDGVGRMYYRIGLTYAPRSLALEPADRGFALDRRYEAVDDPSDVSRDEDGTWRIRAGSRVRVRLTMVAPGRRYHVALVDPLPAGLEPVNPELATSASAPPDLGGDDDPTSPSGYWWWWRPWYEHENLRDERVEAFTSLLWAGVHRYNYIARATTPGNFVVPPTRAEEMYSPETFGRTASDRVIIE